MNLARHFRPPRYRGTEFLDSPDLDPAVAARSLRDIARCNRLFGGASAVLAELAPVLAATPVQRRPVTLLDVGTGAGDIPERLRLESNRNGVKLVTFGVEVSAARAQVSRPRSGVALAADAFALPFGDHSIDIVICSQVLHHFADMEARALLAELNRVARVRVVVAELRRAWMAAGGVWVASWALGFHPVSRHDGVVSVMRGFRAKELADAVYAATGRRATVRDRRGFRVTASWSPA